MRSHLPEFYVVCMRHRQLRFSGTSEGWIQAARVDVGRQWQRMVAVLCLETSHRGYMEAQKDLRQEMSGVMSLGYRGRGKYPISLRRGHIEEGRGRTSRQWASNISTEKVSGGCPGLRKVHPPFSRRRLNDLRVTLLKEEAKHNKAGSKARKSGER